MRRDALRNRLIFRRFLRHPLTVVGTYLLFLTALPISLSAHNGAVVLGLASQLQCRFLQLEPVS